MQIIVRYNPLSAYGTDTARPAHNSAIPRPGDSHPGTYVKVVDRDPAAALWAVYMTEAGDKGRLTTGPDAAARTTQLLNPQEVENIEHEKLMYVITHR